jgi:hypothetical protein
MHRFLSKSSYDFFAFSGSKNIVIVPLKAIVQRVAEGRMILDYQDRGHTFVYSV